MGTWHYFSVIVTLSSMYGSGALAVGRSAGGTLSYELVDEQLPVVVARRLRTSVQAVESKEDDCASVGEKMLRSLEMGTPEVGGHPRSENFDEEYLNEVQQAVREYAAHGRVIIFGRGANVILEERTDLLRLFLHAPRDWRIHRMMESSGLDEKAVAAEVDRMDKARREYMRRWYAVDWGDPQRYDLSLDTSTLGFDGAAAVIVAAVRARE